MGQLLYSLDNLLPWVMIIFTLMQQLWCFIAPAVERSSAIASIENRHLSSSVSECFGREGVKSAGPQMNTSGGLYVSSYTVTAQEIKDRGRCLYSAFAQLHSCVIKQAGWQKYREKVVTNHTKAFQPIRGQEGCFAAATLCEPLNNPSHPSADPSDDDISLYQSSIPGRFKDICISVNCMSCFHQTGVWCQTVLQQSSSWGSGSRRPPLAATYQQCKRKDKLVAAWRVDLWVCACQCVFPPFE